MIPLNLKWSTRRWLFSIITTSILCSLVIISLLWILSVRKKAAKDINEFRVEAVNKQKKILRNEVYDALSFARFHMSAHENLPDSVIKNEVLNWLAMQHFGNAGYVFVNRLDGLALIFDGKRISGSKSIKNMTDPNGKKLFEMELNAAGKAGGDFIEYKFKKMGGEKLFPKISYINSLPEWGWIIGAGDYLDDLSNEVAMVEHNLKKCELKSIGSIFLLLILLTGLNFFFAHKVSTWLDKQFDSIKEFLINSSRNVRYLNLDFFRIQELYEIGDAGNKMVKERAIIEKEVLRYREHLEKLVEKRTKELEKINKKLQEKNADLERFNDLFVDREFRIKELKEKIKVLEIALAKNQ